MVRTNQEFHEAPSPKDDWHNLFLSPDMLSSFRPFTASDQSSNTQVPGVYSKSMSQDVSYVLMVS